ncbi:hypothetical protein JL721_4584 [Aureococcus anophagefferens]|nr:hypothetical protein JL721_4584 [Aureococcus anophagefferens]
MRGDALGRKRLLPKSDDKKLALRPLVNRSSLAQARWTKLRRCSRGGLCCLCSCLFLLVFFDLGVVLNNLLIDLDNLVSPPGAPSARPEEDRGARRVREYMERQWAQASKRRESFLLWDYFDLKAHEELGHRKAPGTWSDLIIAAHGALGEAAQLRLPHPRVRLEWRAADYGDGGRLRSYLLGEADAKDPGLERCAYPAILKVGHIHQQKSTIFLPSEADARSRVDDYVRWTTDRMREKFVDRASWAAQSNPLYASIDACLIVQDVVNPGDFGGEARAARPLELMVEVFWGRAVQAVLTVDAEGELVLGKPQYKNTAEFVVLRDGWAAYKWPLARRQILLRRYEPAEPPVVPAAFEDVVAGGEQADDERRRVVA